MNHLGPEWWERLAIYVVPPLLIALFVVWRAVHKATNHPDQKLLRQEQRKRRHH